MPEALNAGIPGSVDAATANPNAGTTPAPAAGGTPDARNTPENAATLEQQIANEEKRIADKQAYDATLAGKLANLQAQRAEWDRKITGHRQAIDKMAEGMGRNDAPPQAAAPQRPEAPPAAAPVGREAATVANVLGISGTEAVRMMEENPDRFLEALGRGINSTVQRTLDEQKERLYEEIRHRQAAEARQQQVWSELQGVSARAQAAGHNPNAPLALLEQYRVQGFAPSPLQLENELLYGPPDVQRQFLEIGRAYVEEARKQEQAGQQGAGAPPAGTGFAPRGMMLPQGAGIPPAAQGQTAAPLNQGVMAKLRALPNLPR